jgi:hypothetical protein
MEWVDEAEQQYRKLAGDTEPRRTPEDFWVCFEDLVKLLKRTLEAAKVFFSNVDLPGHVQVSVGLQDVRDYRMVVARPNSYIPGVVFGRFSGWRFPDRTFRADFVTPTAELLQTFDAARDALLEQVIHGFDLPPRQPGLPW